MYFTTVTDGVSITTATLVALNGPKLGKFLSEVQATPSPSQSFYQGHSISDSRKQRNHFICNQRNLIDKLIDNLQSRFPNSETISSFSILDPQNLPSSADLPPYGTNEIDVLATHYGESKETDDGLEREPVLYGQELKEEWFSFKHMMVKNFSTASIQGMVKRLLGSSEMEEQFPHMLQLLKLALTIPVSSVDCERGLASKTKTSS